MPKVHKHNHWLLDQTSHNTYNILGLEERILGHHDSIKDAMERPIDWGNVFSKLELWRLKTDTFFSFLS